MLSLIPPQLNECTTSVRPPYNDERPAVENVDTTKTSRDLPSQKRKL